LEDVLHKRMGAQDNLEQFLMTLSDAEGSKKVLDAMKNMAEQMRNIGVNADEGGLQCCFQKSFSLLIIVNCSQSMIR